MFLKGMLGIKSMEENRGRGDGYAWHAKRSLTGLLDEADGATTSLSLCLGCHGIRVEENGGQMILVEVRGGDGDAMEDSDTATNAAARRGWWRRGRSGRVWRRRSIPGDGWRRASRWGG